MIMHLTQSPTRVKIGVYDEPGKEAAVRRFFYQRNVYDVYDLLPV